MGTVNDDDGDRHQMRDIRLNDEERDLIDEVLDRPEIATLGELLDLDISGEIAEIHEQLRRLVVLSAIARDTSYLVGGLRARNPRAIRARGALEELLARQGATANSGISLRSAHFLDAAEIIRAAISGTAAELCESRLKPFRCEDGKGFPRAPIGTWFMRADWRGYVDGLSNPDFVRRLEERLLADGLSERVYVASDDGYDVVVFVDEEADVATTTRAVRAVEIALISEQALTGEARR